MRPMIPKIPKPRKHIELPVVLEVDSILDKISKHGMSKITQEELDFLKNQSNK
jgi:hypothetical protein